MRCPRLIWPERSGWRRGEGGAAHHPRNSMWFTSVACLFPPSSYLHVCWETICGKRRKLAVVRRRENRRSENGNLWRRRRRRRNEKKKERREACIGKLRRGRIKRTTKWGKRNERTKYKGGKVCIHWTRVECKIQEWNEEVEASIFALIGFLRVFHETIPCNGSIFPLSFFSLSFFYSLLPLSFSFSRFLPFSRFLSRPFIFRFSSSSSLFLSHIYATTRLHRTWDEGPDRK